MMQEVQREVLIQDLQRFQGNYYSLEIDLLDVDDEPTVFIYGRKGKFLEAVAWNFPNGIQYLQKPAAVDLLAQEIIKLRDSIENELDSESMIQEWVDLGNAEFVYQLSRDELTLLQEFMYKSFGIIPYQAFAQFYPKKEDMVQLPLPGFETSQMRREREYPTSEAVDIEQRIINCVQKVRTKIDEGNKEFMEDLRYLQSEEVGEYGKNYGEYHTKESDLPSGSLELIKLYFL